MIIQKRLRYICLSFLFVMAVVLTACGDDGEGNKAQSADGNNNNGNEKNTAQIGDKEVTLPYVAWAGCVASTNVVKSVLEKTGYDVTITQVSKGPMYAAVADSSADAHVCTWLPNNGLNLWKRYKDQLIKVNKTIDVAPIGLAVPKYMDIDSIEDMKNNKELGEAIDWTITGIEPGNGTMKLTNEVLKKYGLDKWELQASSGPTMTTVLGQAIDNKEPVIVTLWKPHYAFGKWDLKILKDPKNIYGDPDSIYTVVRKGLEKDSPAAFKILSQFEWNYDLMNKVMVNIKKGMEPAKAAEQFVQNHPKMIQEWTKGVK